MNKHLTPQRGIQISPHTETHLELNAVTIVFCCL